MKINRISDNTHFAGIFCFLILISISSLVTNQTSRLVIISVRLLSIVGILVSVAILFFIKKINYTQLTAMVLYVSFFLYGILMSVFNGAFEVGQQGLLRNAIVTISGLSLIAQNTIYPLPDKLAKHYVWYVFIGLCATIAVGGIDLTFPPHFIFDYKLDSNVNILYSQGMSKFFGFGAVAAAYMISKSQTTIKNLLLLITVLVLLSLSLLGGARGDSAAAVLVVLGYLTFKFQFKFLFCLLISVIRNMSMILGHFLFEFSVYLPGSQGALLVC